jgi:hypothetical protein
MKWFCFILGQPLSQMGDILKIMTKSVAHLGNDCHLLGYYWVQLGAKSSHGNHGELKHADQLKGAGH